MTGSAAVVSGIGAVPACTRCPEFMFIYISSTCLPAYALLAPTRALQSDANLPSQSTLEELFTPIQPNPLEIPIQINLLTLQSTTEMVQRVGEGEIRSQEGNELISYNAIRQYNLTRRRLRSRVQFAYSAVGRVQRSL